METTIKLNKRSEELKMEWYDAEISVSQGDMERSLKDLPALMKQLLEKQGHQVAQSFNRVGGGQSRPVASQPHAGNDSHRVSTVRKVAVDRGEPE